MDYRTLAPGLPASSRLGFGCGGVMGRAGRNQSLRAIAAALEGGITHFDVARLYGYGEAEALVGEALKGQRDRVVVASKFGLNAPRAAGTLRALKPLAQKLAASVPGARAVMRSLVGGAVQASNRFSVTAAQTSLDESLAALKTDYLDILFLHDCATDDL
ncbi:MAG TPA: aldo/keto reductase, partial [Stellaceae bacterium]|nr:aldo/keto reductase [Stellaceae bacterium]